MSQSTPEYDALELAPIQEIDMLDGKGKVSIVSFYPRMCPVGYTPEFLIVQAARVSYGKGLTTPEQDKVLLGYLLRNNHTSPIEMVSVTLRLTLPKAIAIHFLRHRTGKFNEASQRYSEIKEVDNFYNPLNWKDGIRGQSKTNKQGSDVNGLNPKDTEEISGLMEEANDHLLQLSGLYTKMIKVGLAKEIARFWKPMSEYTTMYVQFDLNNLMKLLRLRGDAAHAQLETVEYARAIIKLCEPLFPECFKHYHNSVDGMFLTRDEIIALKTGTPLKTDSKSQAREFSAKIARITPDPLISSLADPFISEPEAPEPTMVYVEPPVPQSTVVRVRPASTHESSETCLLAEHLSSLPSTVYLSSEAPDYIQSVLGASTGPIVVPEPATV